MTSSLVGSEMCIRDSSSSGAPPAATVPAPPSSGAQPAPPVATVPAPPLSVSYTHLTLPTICSV
eukprot:884509-Prorocentrum_lima.AAC.1